MPPDQSPPRIWRTEEYLPHPAPPGSGSSSSSRKQALIILNQPITRHDTLERLWVGSQLRYCADGGANRVFDHLASRRRGEEDEHAWLPEMIKGDLDSLRDDVRRFYADKGVRIEQDKDEYSTDLMKCIAEVPVDEDYRVIILGGLSGRLDQTTHTLSYVQKLVAGQGPSAAPFGVAREGPPGEARMDAARDVLVVSEDCIAWPLLPGKHEIHVDHSVFGQTCGILPLGVQEAHVVTRGLKWDIDWTTSFDGDISTSNHLVPGHPVVEIETDRTVWWTMEIKPSMD